jgi:hypothetical protein
MFETTKTSTEKIVEQEGISRRLLATVHWDMPLTRTKGKTRRVTSGLQFQDHSIKGPVNVSSKW